MSDKQRKGGGMANSEYQKVVRIKLSEDDCEKLNEMLDKCAKENISVSYGQIVVFIESLIVILPDPD